MLWTVKEPLSGAKETRERAIGPHHFGASRTERISVLILTEMRHLRRFDILRQDMTCMRIYNVSSQVINIFKCNLITEVLISPFYY